MLFKIFTLLVVQQFASGNPLIHNEEDIDSVINLLLNGDDFEIEQPDVDVEVNEPVFSDGIWKCGNCDVIDEEKLMYTEVNDVDTNDISDERPIVVQIGLNVENMQCVTVVGGESSTTVRKEGGACVGDTVTLAVFNAKHFLVHVYGP